MSAPIRKVIKIRVRKDKSQFEVDYTDPRDGKRHRPLFATEALANEHASKIAADLEGGAVVDVADPYLTLKAYADRWLAAPHDEITPETLANYRALLTRHVLPSLGSTQLRNELHRRDVKGLLNAKRAAGLSKSTVRLIKAALSTILTDALDDGYIATNPCYSTGRKKKGTVSKTDQLKKVRPLSAQQLVVFMREAVSHKRHFPVFATLATCGLRPGEAFALAPADLRHAGGRALLRIERSVTSAGRVKSTKTGEVRTVHVGRGLAKMLRRLVAANEGAQWLFPAADGGPLDHRSVGHVFRRILKRAKLPPHRLYDLRHTFASLLLNAGAPITYVSAQLGHADPAITLRVYSRWLPTADTTWADFFESALEVGGGLEPKSGTWSPRPRETRLLTARNIVGEPSGDRTRDPLIKSQVLYHLS